MKIKFLFFVLFILIAAGVFYYLEAFQELNREFSASAISLAALISVGAGIYATRVYGLKSYNGKAFLLITIGLFFWFIGELAWLYYQLVLNIDYPFPSIADLFYILAYPLFLAGIIIKMKKSEINSTQKNKNLVLSLAMIVFVASFYLIAKATFEAGLDFWETFFNFAYNIGDSILLTLSFFIAFLVMQYKEGKLFRPWLIFIVALLAMFLGDALFFLYPFEYEQGDNWYYVLSEMSFVLSYLLFSASLFCIGSLTKDVRESFLKST